MILLGIETQQLLVVPLGRNRQRFLHVIPHVLQYGQAK